MKKEKFIKRCETIYDMGLADEKILKLMENWTDAILRYEGRQLDNWERFIEEEKERTHGFSGSEILANDAMGYKIIQLCAILSHPCQKCAEDKNAWHTRTAFCNHKLNLTPQ